MICYENLPTRAPTAPDSIMSFMIFLSNYLYVVNMINIFVS